MEPSLWLKFSGSQLDVRSIPIYELGDTLIAMQRIVHKSFLFENDRLKKHAQLTQDERARLSLQISERRKSSDLYGLIPFMVDPTIQVYLGTLLKVGLGTLGSANPILSFSDTSLSLQVEGRQVTAVPEPTTLSLCIAGLFLLAVHFAWRRTRPVQRTLNSA